MMNVVAKNGRAEVLKAQRHLADAITAYEEVLVRFPHDAIARSILRLVQLRRT